MNTIEQKININIGEFMKTTIILLIIIIIFISVASFYYIRKMIVLAERYQEISIAIDKENQEMWNFFTKLRDEIRGIHLEMKSIDSRGIFEKDDHVGFVFSKLLEMSSELYDYVTSGDTTSENGKQNEK